MTSLKKFLWMVLALVFLGLSWLWEALAPVVQAIVDVLPLRRFKEWVNRQLERLPAHVMLLVFVIPLGLSEGVKIFSFVAFAHGRIVAGALIYVFAEIVRFGVAAYVWKVCREKLLTIVWVAKLHEWLLLLHDWAQRQTAPIKAWIRNALLEAGLVGAKAGLWPRLKALWRYSRRKAAT
ncbi:MAG: hypothetical protein JWO64_1117 [Hyphomicrobiales bacterium]|nr:hypothetical protein [Hyphomicrobiales bacterium]